MLDLKPMVATRRCRHGLFLRSPDGLCSVKGVLRVHVVLNTEESVLVCNPLFNRLSDLFQRTSNAFFCQGATLLDQ